MTFGAEDSGRAPAPEAGLGIDAERSGPCLIFHVAGDIDYQTAGRLREQVITAATAVEPPHVVLDLQEVTFCDSSCVAAFIGIWRAVSAAERRLVLAEVPGQARRLLSHTGLQRFFVIRENVGQALATIHA